MIDFTFSWRVGEILVAVILVPLPAGNVRADYQDSPPEKYKVPRRDMTKVCKSLQIPKWEKIK